MLSALAAVSVAALVCACPAAAAPSAPPLPPSPAITPGAGLAVVTPAGNSGGACTAGFLAYDMSGRPVMLSAGHCDHGGGVFMKYAATGAYEKIGSFSKAIYQGDVGEDADAGLIALNSDIPVDTRILDRRPVVGSTDAVKVGDQLCKYGLTTGRQCGSVTDVTATKVVFAATAEPGDSGGPVYLIRPNGDAIAVGITIRGDPDNAVAELVQPWLQAWGLTLDTTTAHPVGSGR